MRILFCPCHYLFDDSTRGSEYGLAFEIADFFGRKYPESVVVTGKIHLTSQKPYKIIGLLKETDSLGQSISSALHFNYKYTFLALRLLKQEKFDIIHHVRPFNVGTTFNLIPLLGLNRKTPFVIGSFCSPYPLTHNPHDLSLKKITLRLITPLVYWLSIQTLKRSTKIIVHDGVTKKLLTRHLSESKIVIIPPGEKDRPFRLSRSKYYQPKFELLSVGFLIERKGYDIVLRAIAEAVQQNPNITLRIVGDGEEERHLLDLAQQLRITQHVIFEGFIEHSKIYQYYDQAHLYISMPRQEGFGQVYVEAMARGLPIITSSNVGSNQIIHKKFGLLVPQEDSKALANEIVRLLNAPEKMIAMSRHARKHFKDCYEWKNIRQQYGSLYDELLEQ